MRVLGIESSCDDTAVAIYDSEKGLLAHRVFSQTATHAPYGGVVPELASRDHIRKLLPLIDHVISEVGISKKEIQGIAYTRGPGLIGALMAGATVAKSLAYALNIPCMGVHHLESHVMVALLENPTLQFPFIALLISGGHTLLIHVKAFGDYVILGESVDDAVGEAFDKTAKLLGLSFPGGPALAQLAEFGNPERFHFPRPMLQSSDLNFSFSGLKTHAVHCFQQHQNDKHIRADIAFAFEEAVIETLIRKSLRAMDQVGLHELVIVGGVAANKKLRNQLTESLKQRNGHIYYPRLEFCTDNGVMVAYNGWLHFTRGDKEDMAIRVRPRWNMDEL